MGREEYSQIGYGFTEAEARRYAIDDARDEYGHKEGYSGGMNCATGEEDKVKCLVKPKIGKRCKLDKTVQKGARKWETVFVLSNGSMYASNKVELKNSTQGKAIAEAKRLAIKNQCTYRISIQKQLATGTNNIVTVSPAKSERGKWLFTGLARS